jgi:hypothetical protein
MAYALGFARDVTSIIYDMRDPQAWNMTREREKTPSARCFKFTYEDEGHKPLIIVLDMPRHHHVAPFVLYSENMNLARWEYEQPRDWHTTFQVMEKVSKNVILGGQLVKITGQSNRTFIESGRASRFVREREQRTLKEIWFQCEPCGDF